MAASANSTLRVLVADFDLMSSTGGGQTIYRSLFRNLPDIHFTYLRESEPEGFSRPANVQAIPCGPTFFPHQNVTPANEQWIHAFAFSERIAESIGSREFDLLEIPDYHPRLLMLPAALKRRKAKIGKTVVALHGQCSRSMLTSWDDSPNTLHSAELMRVQEQSLYSLADIRWGYSVSNLDDWRQYSPLPTHYMSPLTFAGAPNPTLSSRSVTPPNLVLIGRTERRKGPDLFLEMLWNLPRSAYSEATIIGGSVEATKDVDSGSLLREMARVRELEVSIKSAMTPKQLAEVFASRTIVFVPSRYDTLNLVALESLFAGCPTVIGDGAGVCRLLDEELPLIPFMRFDLKDPLVNVERTLELIGNYDVVHQTIVTNLAKYSWPAKMPNFAAMYRSDSEFEPMVRDQIERNYQEQLDEHHRSRPGLLRRTARHTRALVRPSDIAVKLQQSGYSWFVASYQDRRAKTIADRPAESIDEKRRKIQALENCVHGERFGRAWIWSLLSYLEGETGRDLIAATYALRAMRLSGSADPRRLNETTSTLERHGFEQEATLVNLMYRDSNHGNRHQRLLTWLHDQRTRNMANPPTEFERADDRRGSATPRAAIIVSLYNASSKIPQFLDSLQRQTLVQRREAELILVDSGSPQDEYSPIAAHPCFRAFPSVYVRTGQRETIQQAWNRGLGLVRAPYVTLLGVDETIRPECLDRLAAELDRRPELDWIQADSLITGTDAEGHYDRDLRFYDRQGYHPELVRLETCYLSWVGALYRRNIHDRFGYYDPTFRATGDNEFKLRLLPDLKTDAYPHTLGVFWNYPEPRTTQHPRAEIEDYRAWHVFRTSAGVEYAHHRSASEEIVQAAGHALHYRRSYSQTVSTDLEYACELLRYAIRRDPACFPSDVMAAMEQALLDFRALDFSRWTSFASFCWSTRQIFSRLDHLNRQLARLFSNRPRLTYFNDERCEHINWCWPYLP